MKIETRFNIGDRVVAISQTTVKLPPEPCGACVDGHVELRGERYHCPRCNGKKEVQRTGHGWVIVRAGHVADIRIEHGPSFGDCCYGGKDYDHGDTLTRVQHLLDQIGGGTLYDEPNLFVSHEEAQVECDRRNSARRKAL